MVKYVKHEKSILEETDEILHNPALQRRAEDLTKIVNAEIKNNKLEIGKKSFDFFYTEYTLNINTKDGEKIISIVAKDNSTNVYLQNNQYSELANRIATLYEELIEHNHEVEIHYGE